MILQDYLDKYGIYYKEEYLTAKLSSIKTGGKARFVLYPKSIEELVLLIRLSKAFSARYKIIGGCTNTYFSDNGYDGAIICTKEISDIICQADSLKASAGAFLGTVLKKACACGLELRSELYGIPGSIGGALRNNAGAFGASVSDIFVSGEFYDAERDLILRLDASDLNFSYRYSILQNENIIFLKGSFKAKKNKEENIMSSFSEFSKIRRDTQDTSPSLGSFFKRSGDIIPAKLIDDAGLKGKSFGGAKVSEKHAGFIINFQNASSSDVDTLAKEVESEILKRYNVKLVQEAELVK